MIMSTLAIAEPPYDAVTPQTGQLVVTSITGVLVALTLCYSLVMWQRRKTPFYLLMLVGGFLAVFNEPILDLFSQIYFPRNGSWTVFESQGRPMAAWGVLSYTLFFGTLVIGAVEALRGGSTRLRFWSVVVTVWILNCLLEVTVLGRNIYFYFGYQPFRIGDFPAIWLVLNAVGVVGAAAIFLRFRPFFTGPRLLLSAFVAPACQWAALWLGIPHFITLGTDLSPVIKMLGSAVSIVVSLIVLDVLGRIAIRGEVAPTKDSAVMTEPSLGHVPQGRSAGASEVSTGNGQVEQKKSTRLS
jgi:hypothetical protein